MPESFDANTEMRKVAERCADRCQPYANHAIAAAAAGNALDPWPIPALAVTIDLMAITNFSLQVLDEFEAYFKREEVVAEVVEINKKTSEDAGAALVKKAMTKKGMSILRKGAIRKLQTMAGREFAQKVLAKTAAKYSAAILADKAIGWIPVIGTAISASIGAVMMSWTTKEILNDFVDVCVENAP